MTIYHFDEVALIFFIYTGALFFSGTLANILLLKNGKWDESFWTGFMRGLSILAVLIVIILMNVEQIRGLLYVTGYIAAACMIISCLVEIGKNYFRRK